MAKGAPGSASAPASAPPPPHCVAVQWRVQVCTGADDLGPGNGVLGTLSHRSSVEGDGACQCCGIVSEPVALPALRVGSANGRGTYIYIYTCPALHIPSCTQGKPARVRSVPRAAGGAVFPAGCASATGRGHGAIRVNGAP